VNVNLIKLQQFGDRNGQKDYKTYKQCGKVVNN